MIGALWLLWCWFSMASAHTFDAGFLGLTETAPGAWSVDWSPPQGAALIGRPDVGPDLPCGFDQGVMSCPGELGPVGVDGLDTAALQVVLSVRWLDGAMYTEVLSASQPWAHPRRASGVVASIPVGWEHLWKGPDHLLLVAMLGWVASGAQLFWAIAAFTLGHGLTLALVLSGVLGLPAEPVEALIALSVAWLARDALVSEQPGRGIVVLSLGFGLLHGLGFAGALSELGLPTQGLWRVLIGFHVGLEIGQLAWLAVLLAPLWLLRRSPVQIQRFALYGIGAVAISWTLVRVAQLGG